MGVETALIGGGLGAVGGAIKGGKGTPDQVQKNVIAPAGQQEQQLQQQSLQNYTQAQNLASGLEGQVGGAQSFQDQARQAAGGILSGQAFNVTPEEQARIQSLRDALYSQGSQDIGYNEQQGLQSVLSSAGGRGLRGQALGSLQGQVLDSGTRARTSVANQANTTAAQAYLAAPTQRINAQQGVIGQGLSLADQLRQKAIDNRSALQNPALMNYLQQERIAGATQIRPGQRGGFGGALGGALGGLGQGFSLGGNIASGWNQMGDAANLRAQADARRVVGDATANGPAFTTSTDPRYWNVG